MSTLKNLRATAKQFGLKVSGRKVELESRISEHFALERENFKRISRAERAGKYKALRGLVKGEDQFKNELIRFKDEIAASRRIEKLNKDPNFSELRSKAAKRIKLRGIVKSIKVKGEPILQDLNKNIERELEEHGRRTIIWKLIDNLSSSIVDRVMSKIETLQTAFYLRFSCTYQLSNIETEEKMPFHKNFGSPSLFFNLKSASSWLVEKEEERLSFEKIERPSTKWVFVKWIQVEVKAMLTKQVLLGAGKLPDWLRQKKGLYTLDKYDDNLCVLRCLAVHQGADPKRCTRKAIELGEELVGDVYGKNIKNWPKISLEKTLKKNINLTDVEKKFKIGITVYKVTEEDKPIRLIKRPANYDSVDKIDGRKTLEPMTIGVHKEHAFYIKDIKKVSKLYMCGDCNQQFTNVSNLDRHNKTCSKGATIIKCFNKKVDAPQTAWERAYYPRCNYSKISIRWLEYMSKQINCHIHHARCGHGGERYIAGASVDGYEPSSQTVYQFHGCHYHGCPKHCIASDQVERYNKTKQHDERIEAEGHKLVVMWECDCPKLTINIDYLLKDPVTPLFPHAIMYDFEAVLVKRNTAKTVNLLLESEHVPISVSIGDTGSDKITHICDRDPEQLIKKFVAELRSRSEKLTESMNKDMDTYDMDKLSKTQQRNINNYLFQVPVLGFNSGRYDLNLIKKYFVSEMCRDVDDDDDDDENSDDDVIKVCKKGSNISFIITPKLKFLDIMRYTAAGVSYDKLLKAYQCKQTKSWFPYEWFDDPDKLEYPGLPDYSSWYSKLKGEYVVTEEQFESCKKIYNENGMTKFGDWLEYYNNLDVAPGIEAITKMKEFYYRRGIDIFKDVVSLSGIGYHYMLCGTVRNKTELFAPADGTYELLKTALCGGASKVFVRYHEAGVTKIRSHKTEYEHKICKRIVGYDANALYPYALSGDMPTGKETITEFPDPIAAAKLIKQDIDKHFGFLLCKIKVPKQLWSHFEEMPPLFVNKSIPRECIPEKMIRYAEQTGRKIMSNTKLVGSLAEDRILLYTPLLKWYIKHGLELEAVYSIIEYVPDKCFKWYVDAVTNDRRAGDEHKDLAIKGNNSKDMLNATIGKTIENVERHTNTIYTKNEKRVDAALRSAMFEDLTEIGDAYEIDSRKRRVTIDRPYQVGIAVYQLAKLRVLEFYYDCLDHFIDRNDFELIQMDTDSLYFALSTDTLEEAVKPELRAEFEATKRNWLPWDKFSSRTPGLFKQEWSGHKMIALCSKCYHGDNFDDKTKTKTSCKGMSKAHNILTGERYKNALDHYISFDEAPNNLEFQNNIDKGVNRGFRMYDGSMHTYEQTKLGLSAYYDKRRVLDDGIHTEPLEYSQLGII